MKSSTSKQHQAAAEKDVQSVSAKPIKKIATKRRPTTGELLENLSKYKWNFEAMNGAR